MTSKDIQAGAYPHDPQVFFRFETSYQFPSSETLDISDQQLTDIFDGKFTLQLDSNDLIRIVVMESVTSGSSEETPA
jgi:hypothetical protein